MKDHLKAALIAGLVACALTGTAMAGDPAAGKAKTGTCAACHGANGKAAQAMYPHLACQNEKYLVDAINQYKSGARSNPMMKPMVMSLSDADVENVAAYYSSLPCK